MKNGRKASGTNSGTFGLAPRVTIEPEMYKKRKGVGLVRLESMASRPVKRCSKPVIRASSRVMFGHERGVDAMHLMNSCVSRGHAMVLKTAWI